MQLLRVIMSHIWPMNEEAMWFRLIQHPSVMEVTINVVSRETFFVSTSLPSQYFTCRLPTSLASILTQAASIPTYRCLHPAVGGKGPADP